MWTQCGLLDKALLLFSGDKRFDDHVNCYADIFNISQKDIVDDFVSLQNFYDVEETLVERFGREENGTVTIDRDRTGDFLTPIFLSRKVRTDPWTHTKKL